MSGDFRKGVVIVVFNQDKKVLVCDRLRGMKDENWQFPQGGVVEGESYCDAAFRELKEETNITSVKVVKLIEQPIRYRFPTYAVRGYIGQEQRWVLMYFTGRDNEIKFDTHPEEIEFKAFKWVEPDVPAEIIWKPKQKAYQKAMSIFAPIIEDYKNEDI